MWLTSSACYQWAGATLCLLIFSSCASSPEQIKVPGGSVVVQVFQGDGKTPAPGATVEIEYYPSGEPGSSQVITEAKKTADAKGRALFDKPALGNVILAKSADGRFRKEERLSLSDRVATISLDEAGDNSISAFYSRCPECEPLKDQLLLCMGEIMTFHAKNPGDPYYSFREYAARGIISRARFETVQKTIGCFGKRDSCVRIFWGDYLMEVDGLDTPISFSEFKGSKIMAPR